MLMLVDGIKWSRTRESRVRWHASAQALEKYTRLAMGKLDFSIFYSSLLPKRRHHHFTDFTMLLDIYGKTHFRIRKWEMKFTKRGRKRELRAQNMYLVRSAERRQKLFFTTFENGAFCVWMRSRNDDEAGGELNEVEFNFRLDFKAIQNSLIACLRGKRLNFDLSNDENYNEIV